MAPAIPAQGRFTERGRLIGAGIAAPIDVAARFAGSGVDLDVPETRDEAGMDAALARFIDRPPTLLVGAAGLAAALGRRLAPGGQARRLDRLSAPMLLAIGSRDPITLAQVKAVHAERQVTDLPAPDGRVTGVRPIGEIVLLQLVQGGPDADPGKVGASFARTAAALSNDVGARTLFACGGETADGILGELGVAVLVVEGELLPGVPVSRMDVGGRPMRLVTKSGGFGGADTLVSVIDAASGPP